MKRIMRDSQGVIIVEVLLSLVILVFVVATVYPVFFTGNRAFGRGQSQYTIHNDVGAAAERISKAVRYATYVYILPYMDPSMAASGDENFIFVDYDGEGHPVIVLRDKSGDTVLAGQGSANDSLALLFKRTQQGKAMYFKISGKNGDQPYAIESQAVAQNIETGVIDLTDGQGGAAILFGGPSKAKLMVEVREKTVCMLEPENTSVDPLDCTWTLEVANATVRPGMTVSDLVISGLPKNLTATASGSGHLITITVSGTALESIDSERWVDVMVRSSAVVEDAVADSSQVQVRIVPGVMRPPERYLVCAGYASFKNKAEVTGDVLIKGEIGDLTFDNVSTFNGNVYIDDDLVLNNKAIFGNPSSSVDLKVRGDAVFKNNATVYGNFYYQGSLTGVPYVTGSTVCGPVTIPTVYLPDIYSEQWYSAHGYTVITNPSTSVTLLNDGKYLFLTDYAFSGSQSATNVRIVTSGNITFDSFTGSGVFYAPYGQVQFVKASTLTGLIASQSTLFKNNATLIYQKFDDLPYCY